MTYTVDILQVCQLYLNEAGKTPHQLEIFGGKAGVEAQPGVWTLLTSEGRAWGCQPACLGTKRPPARLDMLSSPGQNPLLRAQVLADGLWETDCSQSESARPDLKFRSRLNRTLI